MLSSDIEERPDEERPGEGHEAPQRSAGRYKLPRRGGADEAGSLHAQWRERLKDSLNQQQLEAVTAPAGPVLVLAGAGSGKTRVITYRVAFLVGAMGVRPQQILLTTFTNKAARSMLDRVEQVVGDSARAVTGGTFHHVANLLLRRHCELLGYDRNFTILDDSDSRAVMKLSRNEVGQVSVEKAFPSERLLQDIASAVVNTHTPLDRLLTRRYPHLMEFHDSIQRVLIDYQLRKAGANQMDYDDLLVNLLRLLAPELHGASAGLLGPEADAPLPPGVAQRDLDAVRREICGRYTHILVDEYQDVNHVQAEIVRRLYLGESLSAEPSDVGSRKSELAGPDSTDTADGGFVDLDVSASGFNTPQLSADSDLRPPTSDDLRLLSTDSTRGLFVVGDDAQSIYSFRGADYNNIRSFPDRFTDGHVFKLEINYRSTPQVLELANAILQDGDPLFRKTLRPVKPAGAERPLLLACRDGGEQAEFVAEQILSLREDAGLKLHEMAVLYRAHNNRLEVELELTKRRIPFVVRGGLRFFEQAHIKDLLSYVVVMANSRDEIAWQRMLGMINRVGPKTIADVLVKLRGPRGRFGRTEDDEYGGPLGRFTMNGVADSARGQAKTGLMELRDFLRGLRDEQLAGTLPASDLLRRVLTERYHAYLEVTYDNWRQRLEDLEQLIVFASRFDSLAGFLSEIGLSGSFTGQEIIDSGDVDDPEEGAVTLSTIHQSKGLEWRSVFVISVQDDVIPHRMTRANPEEEDEERRLLYVAVTRAEEMLFMSYPQVTETRDFQRIINRVSRFLHDLPGKPYDEAVLEWG
ncbi:ATP-dependent helicase [bacterium]|nr:ATP-dependent helicase [bacterium]